MSLRLYALVFLLSGPTCGLGSTVTLSLIDQNGSPAPSGLTQDGTASAADYVRIVPGDSFSIDVDLGVTAASVSAVSFWLREATSSGFAITGRTIKSADLADPITADATLVSQGALTPVNGRDIGVTTTGVLATASETLMTLTIAAGNGVPLGTYTLVFGNSPNNVAPIWSDAAFAEKPFDLLNSYTVQVIPEPVSALLLGVGILVTFTGDNRRANHGRFSAQKIVSL